MQGQGTASLVGFGATPQQFHGRPASKRTQQRRRQRSVPASNFARPQTRPQAALSTYSTLSRQMGATDQHREKSFSLAAGLFCCRDFASAEATRGLCGRPLDCFAAHTPIIDFVCCMENRVYGHNSGAQNPPPCKKPPRFARSGYCYPQRFHISCTYSTSMSSNASSPFFASAFASPWRTKHIVTKLRAEKIAA